MGNRHGGEKPREEKRAAKEEKKKRKKEKKSRQKGQKKKGGGSDIDVDMESSHVSHADSESMVFHSAENLSPYLDASTRSDEGAVAAGFQDNGHVLSSRDFHDGFSIEACLPADLAAIGRITDTTDVSGDTVMTRSMGDDVTSVASGGYSTPLLSSPQVRRGVPRSPLAQRPKDSFLEPVPPIPSDFSSNTLSSAASGHEDLPSSGERSSSRASSSTIDTNPAHCIERLEELERKIERTIIEKFSDGTSPLLRRRAVGDSGEGSREGSVTPKRLSGGGIQSVDSASCGLRAADGTSAARKAQDANRQYNREGSITPKGIVRGLPSQSAENSPVVLRKAQPKQESPSLARRTPTGHGSPTLSRAAAPKTESPVILRRNLNTPESPSTARRTPESPRLQQRAVGSPRTGRRRAPESPLLRRKGVPLSEDSSSTDQEPPYTSKDSRGRGRLPGFHDNQSPQKSPSRSPGRLPGLHDNKSPSRSPEVRKKPGTNTPSSSPSPRSLGRKKLTTDDKTPAAGSSSPVTQIKFCELNKGTPVKHCIVSTQPSTAVVLSSISLSQDSVDNDAEKDSSKPFAASVQKGPSSSSQKPDAKPSVVSGQPSAVSGQSSAVSGQSSAVSGQSSAVSGLPLAASSETEDAIKESSETAVFGSVSPKLKRQKKILEQSLSFDRDRTGWSDGNTRSPPCSPPQQRARAHTTGSALRAPGNIVSTRNVNVIDYKKTAAPTVCISTLKYPPTPESQRSTRTVAKQSSDHSEDQSCITADITGRMTFHSQLSVESVGSPKREEVTTNFPPPCASHKAEENLSSPTAQRKGHMSPPQRQKFGREDVSHTGEPVYSRIQKSPAEKKEPPVVARKPVFHTTGSIDEGTAVLASQQSGGDRGALIRANTVPTPAWTGEDEAVIRNRGAEQNRGPEQRSFSPGNTVQWNAYRPTEGQACFQDLSRLDEKNVRASGERGARAKLAPSSRSLSDSGSSTSGHGGKKNLGERIREVIHESHYKETFTAELSPTCSSEDPDHIPHIDDDWDTFPGQYSSRPHRDYSHSHSGYSGSSVDSHSDSLHSDSPYYPHSPPVPRRRVTKVSAEKRTDWSPVTAEKRTTDWSRVSAERRADFSPRDERRPDFSPASGQKITDWSKVSAEKRSDVSRPGTSHDRDTRLSNVVVQGNTSYLPESITIRRIDVDANVTLPYQPLTSPHHGQTSSTSPVLCASSAHTTTESGHRARGGRYTAGVVPGGMDSSVDPDITAQSPGRLHTSPAFHTGDACSLPEQQSNTQQKKQPGDTDTQTRVPKQTGGKTERKETTQQEPSATRKGEKQTGREQNSSDRDRNTTQEKGDKQMSVSGSSAPPSLSSHPSTQTSHPSSSQARLSPSHPLPSASPLPKQAATIERQEKKSEKESAGDLNYPEESLSAASASQNSAPCQNNATNSQANGGAKISTDDQLSDRSSQNTTITSQTAGNLGDKDVAGTAIPADRQGEILQQVHKNGIAEIPESGNPKPSGNDDTGKEPVSEHVPPPSPTAMEMLMEEEEEEDDEDMFNAHKDSDISFMISKEMQQFGETVVKRLSSLLESQASESDSCLEDGRGRSPRGPRAEEPARAGSSALAPHGARAEKPAPALSKQSAPDGDAADFDDSSVPKSHTSASSQRLERHEAKHTEYTPDGVPYIEEDTNVTKRDASDRNLDSSDVQDTLAATGDLKPTLTPSFPSAESFLTESDTTETCSCAETLDTATSSNRASTTSTATDETLTSFKTRSTDSADYDEAHFVLPESLVFVRSVDEDDGQKVEDVVVESGGIIKRPISDATPAVAGASSENQPQKPRKKRRRQPASAYDNVTKNDVNEPEPKRGSKQIRDVIDAYCDEDSEEGDVSSGSERVCFRDVVRESECSPVQRRKEYVEQQVFVRKPKPPADRSTDSSEEDSDAPEPRRKRLSSSSVDSSLRIPEIEETFSELMGVKTFLDDLEDRTPTAEAVPVFVPPADVRSKDHWSAANLRRSRTSPAKTDRTESDLDMSEQRDDASTDSMYADDEDEGNEVVFQRSYSEEHGGEVVLSCTIYNSSHDNDADSDDFWAESSAAEESYKKLETAADEAGSAFQNARIQMHDIHQHLQDLRRQMELLQDDITSRSLTLTPDYSLDSCEPRPVVTE